MKDWWCLFRIIPILETVVLLISFTDGCPDICSCWNLITNCQNNDLDQLPDGIDPQVTDLDLSINKFENIPEALKIYENLENLNLSFNQIATLGHLDFDGMSNLEALDLSSNSFRDWKDIHSQAFILLPNLTTIDFSNNPVSSLPQYSIHFRIPSLETLKLSNCSMFSLPSGFVSGMTNIKKLLLDNNAIENIEIVFTSKTLKYLDISHSILTYVAPNSFQDSEVLETLLLNKNKYLRNITINSASLLYLDLSESFLETPPFGSMRSLKILNLHGNIIRELTSNNFRGMPNVIFINLSLNAITAIELNAFRGLEDLKTLDLSVNKINTIEADTFLATKSLVSLDLSHNYLTTLDGITSLSLAILEASFCEIKSIGKYTLSNLPKLSYLSLQRNFISIIPDELDGDTLRTLDLSECRIKSINNKTFTEMRYLLELDLSNNRLTTIQASYFPPGLTTVRLKDNQWRCDCAELKDTFEWLQRHGSFVNDLICDSPDNVDGFTWESACQNQWNPPTEKQAQIWWYSIALLISMMFLLFTVIALRKLNDIREKRFQEFEENRRQQEREARESLLRMQQMQREFREEANRNAPDPRESQGPPSYNDALLLPRLDSSHPSLAGSLHSLGGSIHGSNPEVNKKGKIRRKRRRRRSESTERIPRRAAIEDSNESDPERTQRPLESDF